MKPRPISFRLKLFSSLDFVQFFVVGVGVFLFFFFVWLVGWFWVGLFLLIFGGEGCLLLVLFLFVC